MNTLNKARIAFVGGGTMAEALMRRLLEEGLAPSQITVSEPLAERRAYLVQGLGISAVERNTEAVVGADIVVLAVKPQILGGVLQELRGSVPQRDTLVLSIVAGADVETIRDGLACEAIVRSMPNTPGQIGEGITVWMATPACSLAQREQAREIIGVLGQEILVEDEKYLDMATAISGSGPAYVFLFIEALVDAGVHLGFSRPVAEQLVLQTVRGSAAYAQNTGTHPTLLRNMVTSPGGTTAEALGVLEQEGFRAALAQAVWACYERAQELGGHHSA